MLESQQDRDPASSGGGEPSSQEERKKRQAAPQAAPEEPPKEKPLDEGTLRDAVRAFQGETQPQGLHADVVGHAPGLRVVLKDVRGQVIRQFSGEEFLKLRANSTTDARARGKILDRKY